MIFLILSALFLAGFFSLRQWDKCNDYSLPGYVFAAGIVCGVMTIVMIVLWGGNA